MRWLAESKITTSAWAKFWTIWLTGNRFLLTLTKTPILFISWLSQKWANHWKPRNFSNSFLDWPDSLLISIFYNQILIFSVFCKYFFLEMKFALLTLLSLGCAEEHQNEVFVVYPGGEEHTFTKSMVNFIIMSRNILVNPESI